MYVYDLSGAGLLLRKESGSGMRIWGEGGDHTGEILFHFTDGEKREHHHAMIGMASVMDNYPLYAEAVNEKGLCMAGLYYPGNAVYRRPQEGMVNLASWELIPYLADCSSLAEAGAFLKRSMSQTGRFGRICRRRRCTG